MTKSNTAQLQRALGHVFADLALLRQALTHRSYGSPHNERLEFLGDSVLNCAVAHVLYQAFPQVPEGSLSRLRASLVRQETLADIAAALALGEHLRLGEGELKSGGFRRPSILADALESLIGAIFLDAGFAAASAVVAHLMAPHIAAIDPQASGKDAKTSLQEWLQGRREPLPEYLLVATEGQAHDQEFVVECRLKDGRHASRGRGKSRRAAEQDAARAMLAWLEGA